MYLRGSKWTMRSKPHRRSNPWRIMLLLALIGVALYFNQVVVPAMPPMFIPTPTPTRNPESYVNEAVKLYSEGKLTQAIDAYKEAISSDPNNPSNYVELARLQAYSGNYSEALVSAQNALLKNPTNPMAHAIHGWILSLSGDYLAAEAALRRALDLDANNAMAHAFLAEMLVAQGNYDDLNRAIEESRVAKQLDPTLLEVHRARGLVLLATGAENYAEAVAEFKAAIAINDKIADLHLSLGYAYKLMGENDLAVEELLTAFALNPSDPSSLTEVSLAYANEGQFGKASQYAEQAVRVDPASAKLHGNLGVMYYRNQQMSSAVEELELAVRGGSTAEGVAVEGMPLDYGTSAQYYWFYGFALAKTNRCSEAIPIFQALLAGVPDYQLAVDNANAGLDLCRERLDTPEAETPTPTEETPVPTEVAPTP